MKTDKQLLDEIADLRIKYPEKKFCLGTTSKTKKITGKGSLCMEITIIDENNIAIEYETFLSENGYVYDNEKWITLAEWREQQIKSILKD
jgi:hypothetical protein